MFLKRLHQLFPGARSRIGALNCYARVIVPYNASVQIGVTMFVVAVLLIVIQPPLKASPKICVATVANASAVSAPLERLTQRLVKSIQGSKMKAVAMDSSTTMQPKLRPTRQNSDEAEEKQCDYTLLTQIVETRVHPGIPQTRNPRPGASVPSVDASDPMGGESGPVYREEIEIAFALFRSSHYDPVVDNYILERASANVSDTFLASMDRIANRVIHDLTKKYD